MVMVSVAIVLVAIAAAAAMWVFNDRVMSAGAPKIMKVMVAAFFPPPDLYGFIVRDGIDLSRAGNKEVMFKARYTGRHDVGILLHNFDSDKFYGALYTFPLKLKLTFLRGSTEILSTLVGASPSPFIGKEVSGFQLFTFDVPDDLPIGKDIICRIEVVSPDVVLNSTYGPAEFFVRKISDK